ncbi:hypothetical protein RZO31_09945 [Lactococcus lactis]|uniref:Major structural protein 1 jelly-roll domain-containing protein n=1 Tax=Lactococcus lactis TaxID=1358 RepID=A0AAE4SZK3_9LACT|nr:hypothetical protein [Lactococcus lactis]MDV2633184.1 hypothetical protein [Lactococcus lactis]
MAVWAFPFVSANGDRAYGPADWMQFYANIFSTGIVPNTGLPGYTGFQVVQTDTPSLNINVGPGAAIIKGGQIMNTAPKSFQIPAPLTSQSRTDSLVVQWNNSSRSGDVIYKTNSIQVTQTADVYELQIATINVPANASSIAQSNITDTRADTKVCGYSSPYESIKTGDLLAQFKSELEANGVVFSDWFENIKGQLSEDAAGNLQNEIDNLTSIKADDSKVVHNTGDETIAGKKTFNEVVNMPRFADSYVAFFANKGGGNTVTFTAPWDCTAEVELFYHGWGYGGGEWEIGITTPSGLTQIYEATGYTNGHNNQAMAMPTKAIYSGLKKGQQYTFDKRDASGRAGGSSRPMMIVKLYRN